ncbi:MAG: hypothetical protein GTO18_18380 [Anaerolineales bacterium]|nr:hypothetical protein [Anaerolineales bacterium]
MSAKKAAAPTGSVLSVDIASGRYSDNGIAFLAHGSNDVEIIKTRTIGLTGKPQANEFAFALHDLCIDRDVTVMLFDGPQGWKSPKTKIEHMRVCERVLNTPGKTGIIGEVKPKTFLLYITFSINLFHILRVDYGWQLLREDWAKKKKGGAWIVESFPSSAWRTLGLKKLPSKSKSTAKQLEIWRHNLSVMTGLNIPKDIKHDELQAAAVLTTGRAIAEGDSGGVILSGMDPIITSSGDVLEGWIANPLLGEI